MVHMSYVPTRNVGQDSSRTRHATTNCHGTCQLAPPFEIRGGATLGTRTWSIPKRLRRRHDEDGAETVKLALVVVLLIALLYGVISCGLILLAQSSVTQAAADGARAGIVASTTAIATAEAQAGTDVGWMNKGICGTSGTTIACVASEAPCASNARNQCLTVTVTYNYNSNPLFPELPGMGLIMPSTISSTHVLQISNPSS